MEHFTKSLDLISSYSQSLSQLAILVLSGSIGLIFSSSSFRPKYKLLRIVYFLLVIGWLYLLFSIYNGSKVQQNILALSIYSNADVNTSFKAIQDNLQKQIDNFFYGIVFICSWVLYYLTLWIFFNISKLNDTKVAMEVK